MFYRSATVDVHCVETIFLYFTKIPSFHDSTSRHLSKIMRLKNKGKQYRKHLLKKTILFPGFKKSLWKFREPFFRTKNEGRFPN